MALESAEEYVTRELPSRRAQQGLLWWRVPKSLLHLLLTLSQLSSMFVLRRDQACHGPNYAQVLGGDVAGVVELADEGSKVGPVLWLYVDNMSMLLLLCCYRLGCPIQNKLLLRLALLDFHNVCGVARHHGHVQSVFSGFSCVL